MPHLHLIKDNEISETFPLEDGEAFLGREEHCEIRVGFPGVSRRHLRLLTVMGDTFVEDLGSRNGTYVNGRLARKCALNDGDVLQIGQVEFRYEKDSANEGSMDQQDPDATAVLPPGQFGPQSRAARESGADIEGTSPVAHLLEKANNMQPMRTTAVIEEPGLWGRIRAWLGI